MNYYKPTKKPLPESAELKQQKIAARKILAAAFDEIHETGLKTVCFDVKWGELINSYNISVISQEELEHGIWVA